MLLILLLMQLPIAPRYRTQDYSSVISQLENNPVYFLLLFLIESLAFIMAIAISSSILKQYLLAPHLLTYEQVKKRTLKNFPKYVASSFLIMVVLGIVGVLFHWLFEGIGVFIFIVGVGSVYGMFTFIVMEIEEKKLYAAIRRSFQLIKGHWWESVGFIMTFFVMIYFLIGLFSIPFIIGVSLYELHNVSISQEFLGMDFLISLSMTASSIGTLFMFLLLWIAVGVHYFHLVEQREMIGLMEQIDMIGKPVQIQEEETY